MYGERRSALAGAIVWRSLAEAGESIRVLPDGCLDIMWSEGELVVAGPDTVAFLAPVAPGTRHVGLRFAPGTAPAVLGVPASELRNQRVPLAQLWPAAGVRRATDLVAGAACQGAALEEIARARLPGSGWPDPALAHVVSRLRAGASVEDTASVLGSGARQLHRRSLVAFGYGPKTLARILRMNRALGLARTGAPLASVAAATGYADQAHLAREVKAMAGVTLRELIPRELVPRELIP